MLSSYNLLIILWWEELSYSSTVGWYIGQSNKQTYSFPHIWNYEHCLPEIIASLLGCLLLISFTQALVLLNSFDSLSWIPTPPQSYSFSCYFLHIFYFKRHKLDMQHNVTTSNKECSCLGFLVLSGYFIQLPPAAETILYVLPLSSLTWLKPWF